MDAPVVAAAITAAVALLVGVGTVWQKWRSDRRDAWWKRAQWAIDKSLSRRPRVQSIGLLSMEIFSRDRAVTDLDVRVLKLAVQRAKNVLRKRDDKGMGVRQAAAWALPRPIPRI